MRPALALVLLMMSGAALLDSSWAAPIQAPSKPAAPAPKEVVSEDKLFAQLKAVEREEDAHPIEQKLMAIFRASGSPSVDLLITRVQAAMVAADKQTAKKLIDAVTTIAPQYAEGWHIRAGLEHAADDDTAALVSLQKTVQLNPRHFRALDELADMLEEYGDKAGALKLYRRALELNPHLPGTAQKVRELTTKVEGRDI